MTNHTPDPRYYNVALRSYSPRCGEEFNGKIILEVDKDEVRNGAILQADKLLVGLLGF